MITLTKNNFPTGAYAYAVSTQNRIPRPRENSRAETNIRNTTIEPFLSERIFEYSLF